MQTLWQQIADSDLDFVKCVRWTLHTANQLFIINSILVKENTQRLFTTIQTHFWLNSGDRKSIIPKLFVQREIH